MSKDEDRTEEMYLDAHQQAKMTDAVIDEMIREENVDINGSVQVDLPAQNLEGTVQVTNSTIIEEVKAPKRIPLEELMKFAVEDDVNDTEIDPQGFRNDSKPVVISPIPPIPRHQRLKTESSPPPIPQAARRRSTRVTRQEKPGILLPTPQLRQHLDGKLRYATVDEADLWMAAYIKSSDATVYTNDLGFDARSHRVYVATADFRITPFPSGHDVSIIVPPKIRCRGGDPGSAQYHFFKLPSKEQGIDNKVFIYDRNFICSVIGPDGKRDPSKFSDFLHSRPTATPRYDVTPEMKLSVAALKARK